MAGGFIVDAHPRVADAPYHASMPEDDVPMRPSVVAARVTRRIADASMAAVGVLVLVGLLAPGPATARDAVVRIADFEFTPARVRVEVGDRVDWVMGPDPEQHTVTPDREGAFPGSPVLQPGDPGDRHRVTFQRAGRFPYHCELHPNMTGVVTVVAAAVGSSSPSPPRASPSAAASIEPSPTETTTPSAPASRTPGASPTAAFVSPSASPAPPTMPGPAAGAELGLPVVLIAGVAAVLASLVLLGRTRRRPS